MKDLINRQDGDKRETTDVNPSGPDDVDTRIAAAYACDREGRERDAIAHYDAAWKLGVPQDRRVEFLLGYGSTLKNVGRLHESEAILRLAIDEAPEHAALPVFLALTLHAASRNAEAIAQLLDVLLTLAAPGSDLDAYRQAITSYRDELMRS